MGRIVEIILLKDRAVIISRSTSMNGEEGVLNCYYGKKNHVVRVTSTINYSGYKEICKTILTYMIRIATRIPYAMHMIIVYAKHYHTIILIIIYYCNHLLL